MTMVLSIYILGAFSYFLIRLITDTVYSEDGLPSVTTWLCYGVIWPLFLVVSVAEHFREALWELQCRLSNLFRR